MISKSHMQHWSRQCTTAKEHPNQSKTLKRVFPLHNQISRLGRLIYITMDISILILFQHQQLNIIHPWTTWSTFFLVKVVGLHLKGMEVSQVQCLWEILPISLLLRVTTLVWEMSMKLLWIIIKMWVSSRLTTITSIAMEITSLHRGIPKPEWHNKAQVQVSTCILRNSELLVWLRLII